MTRLPHAALAALAVLLFVSGERAVAQNPYYPNYSTPYSVYPRAGVNPFSRPALSPYLDLLRGGNVAANYYLGVIPEIYRRQADLQYQSNFQFLGQQQRMITQEVEGLTAELGITGHPTAFQNFGTYFTPVVGGRPAPVAVPIQPTKKGKSVPR
jgi:hypothetical protein